MLKIHHKDKVIYLCQREQIIIGNRFDHCMIDADAITAVNWNKLLKTELPSICYIYTKNDFEALKLRFFGLMKSIAAAGGLVQNFRKEYLLIYRRGNWDLPKGKIDPGETKKQAALREVEEECGIDNLVLGKAIDLGNAQANATYHTYTQRRQWVIKPSYWYHMSVKNNPELVPQLEEDIEQAIWVPKKDLIKYYDPMYPAIKDILKAIIN